LKFEIFLFASTIAIAQQIFVAYGVELDHSMMWHLWSWQYSCAFTVQLCIHSTVVHSQYSCAFTVQFCIHSDLFNL